MIYKWMNEQMNELKNELSQRVIEHNKNTKTLWYIDGRLKTVWLDDCIFGMKKKMWKRFQYKMLFMVSLLADDSIMIEMVN